MKTCSSSTPLIALLVASMVFILSVALYAWAECPPMQADVVASKHVSCVLFDRKQARSLGVPRRLHVWALAACLAKRGDTMLVYGTDKKGRLRCDGSGKIKGPDFEACGLLW